MLRFGHEIRWYFAVADARNDVVFCRCGCVIESHAARACLSQFGRGAGSELGKLEDGYFSCRFRKQR